jgi:predicted O-methyltransferase YrrM
MYKEPKHIVSSYTPNNIGKTIYDIVRKIKPKKVIEFGALYGYSAICIGQALRDNGFGKLITYDIFEKYKYKHSDRNILLYNLNFYNLTDIVSVEFGDFYDFIKGGFEFDMAHIDISNTGEIIEKVIESYPNKTILFEGGSKERDIIDWMVKYKAKPLNYIQKEILNNNFPSISLIKK